MRNGRLHDRLARLQERYDPGVGPTMDDAYEEPLKRRPRATTGGYTLLSPENLSTDSKERDGV